MSTHPVDIDAHVKSSDGKDLGKVHQLIVRGGTNRVGGFVLSTGLFGDHKIVPARAVASSSEHEVVLSLTAAEAEKLENVVKAQMMRAPDGLTYGGGFGGLVDVGGTGDQWVLHGSGGGQYPHTGSEAFFFEAPMGNVQVENVSSLSADALLISEGTDVVGSDFKKIGHIDQIMVDGEGVISSILVKAGWLFKHDIHIPIELVAGASSDHVRLTVTADEAEKLTAAN